MWYAKVEDDQVVKIRDFPGPDAVLEPKLIAHGYRLGEAGAAASYDSITQNRSNTPTYDIQAEKVVRTYAVTDKSLEAGQTGKKAEARKQAQSRILTNFPAWVQDDVALGIYDSDVGDPLKAYISAVMVESNRVEDAVDAAETPAEIRAIVYD